MRDGGKVIVRTGVVEMASAIASLSNTASPAALKVGDVMPEEHEHAGWIYGGISKTTRQAVLHRAQRLRASCGGRRPWTSPPAPTRPSHRATELNQMYEARNEGALKGTFNTTGSDPAGWYWSSSQYDDSFAWAQRFSDGYENDFNSRTSVVTALCPEMNHLII